MLKFIKNLFKNKSLPWGEMNKPLNNSLTPSFDYFDQWNDDIDQRPGYL